MKIIHAVDALFPPLTGIGRYAANLLLGLRSCAEISAIRCFAHARWVDGDALLRNLAVDAPADDQAIDRARPSRLRATLAANPIATRTYAALMPLLAAARLRSAGDYLFHSPNFMLPRFPGPSVVTIHDLSTVNWRHCHPKARLALMDRALPRALERATCLITPSEAVRGELIRQFGLAQDRVFSTPLGVTPAYTPEARERGALTPAAYGLEKDRYFLCVATLEPRKNIDGLLDAFEALPSALRARLPLVLVGAAGWGSEKTRRRIERLQGRSTLRHLGYVPEADLPALIACARALVFPAFYEGFGLPVLEAMACGTPVICSTTPALVELAGEAGCCVDAHSHEALAAAMARAAEDEAWHRCARERGIARAQGYSWERTTQETVGVYRKALEVAA